MSTYLAATEITGFLPAAYASAVGASTVPLNLGEVGQLSVQVGALFNGAALAAGYAVPISSAYPMAFDQARLIVREGVLCRVMRQLAPNRDDAANSKAADPYCAAYNDAMKLLREGKLPLVGAPEDTSGEGRELPRSFETSYPGDPIGGASPILSTRQEF